VVSTRSTPATGSAAAWSVTTPNLAVGSDGALHAIWTGSNELAERHLGSRRPGHPDPINQEDVVTTAGKF
jgi:hypothetical protein